MGQDLRIALRRLGKTPGFTAVTVLTLALAIGANTTTFSALNRFLLRPLPVDRPNELVTISSNGITQSYPDYRDFRDRNRTLSGLIAYRIAPVALSQGGKNIHLWGYEATGNYFDVLGVRAMLGRGFTPEDDQRSSPHPVIVLSYSSWQNRFGGDPNVIGKQVKLNGLNYNIVGVAPKGFFGTEILLAPEFWVPMAMEPQIEPGNTPWLDRRATHNIWALGRLRPGVTAQQAAADLKAIAADLGRIHREDDGMRIQLSRPGLFGSFLRGPVVGFASVLVGVAGLVLLIACVNIAGMLLARATERRREVSICLAIGAARSRLVGQLLTESLLLSLAGGAAGVLLAIWILKALAGIQLPIDLPGTTELPFDTSVFLFSAAVCILTTLLFGLAPAIQAVRIDLVSALKNQISDRFRRIQTKDLLVAAQVTLAVILLVGTVLVVRSLQRAITIDVGFNPHHAAAVSFDLGLNGYDEQRGRAFERRLMDQLASLAGIESYALADWLPLGLAQSNSTIYAEGKPVPKFADAPMATFYSVSPGYFRTMQTRLVAGRDFDIHDTRDSTRVAIVNEAFARRLFPGEDALGKRFRTNPERTEWAAIVGIVQDGKYQSLNDNNAPALFWPRSQRYDSAFTVVVRSSLPPDQVVHRIQQIVTTLDPTLPFFQADSLDDYMKLPLMPARIAASMLGAFGLIAIVLAATGVYGMMAYSISRRTREIGIRVAIGAGRGNIVRLVLRRAVLIIGAASVLGAGLALVLGRFFTPILYGVSPRDPATYAMALLLMSAVALIACYVPTRRALRIEPAVALRDE
ncbi:MAG TPA: ABC transporter permease [Bryobacteraceae bacterium]|nr:ABC transporter permease [Bryobacteraceae bacterium]